MNDLPIPGQVFEKAIDRTAEVVREAFDKFLTEYEHSPFSQKKKKKKKKKEKIKIPTVGFSFFSSISKGSKQRTQPTVSSSILNKSMRWLKTSATLSLWTMNTSSPLTMEPWLTRSRVTTTGLVVL